MTVYAGRIVVLPPPIIPAILQVGIRAGYSSPATSVTPHPLTRAGDLMILTLLGGFGVYPTCTDGRMHYLSTAPVNPSGTGYVGGRGWGVWWGHADAPGATIAAEEEVAPIDPLTIFTQGNFNATGQFAGGTLWTVRKADTTFLTYDGGYNADSFAIDEIIGYLGASGHLPRLGGFGPAILVHTTWGGFGGAYGTTNFALAPEWQYLTGDDDAYWVNHLAAHKTGFVNEHHWVQTDADDIYRGMAIRIREVED